MRVAIVTESFHPQVNGVSNTVQQLALQLRRTGHRPLVIAPGRGPLRHHDVPVVRTRSVVLPVYRSFPVGMPDRAVEHALEGFNPDVVHLASPVALGAVGLRSAKRLRIPTVAVYQTDLSGFAAHYGVPVHGALERWVAHLHRRADRSLVPSSASLRQLRSHGVPHLHLWRRGVDVGLFRPDMRSEPLRAAWQAVPSEHVRDPVIVGYVGRLAAEKQAFASLDVFVHPGESETFCQTVQEAQASGVAVVAPAAGGPLDLVDHRRTGLLYDPAETASLRRTVSRLVCDPGLRRSLAGAAYEQVRERSWENVVRELVEEHYAPVVAPRRDRPAA